MARRIFWGVVASVVTLVTFALAGDPAPTATSPDPLTYQRP